MRFLSLLLILGFLAGCSNSLTPDIEKTESGTKAIYLSLPEEGHIKVWVENAYGTTIKVLADEIKPAGTHSFLFDFTDKNGNPIPQGLYNFHVTFGEHYLTRSFIYDATLSRVSYHQL